MDADDDSSVIPQITREIFANYVSSGIIQGGMIPKLENAYEAIDAGVKEVIITKSDNIFKGGGTRVI